MYNKMYLLQYSKWFVETLYLIVVGPPKNTFLQPLLGEETVNETIQQLLHFHLNKSIFNIETKSIL